MRRWMAMAGEDREFRMSREDQALDRVLQLAPADGAAGSMALTERIMRAAAAEAGGGRPSDNIPLRRTVADRQARLDTRAWRVAATLAASLALGVLAGASTVGEPAVTALIEVAGLSETDDLAWDAFDLYPVNPLEEQL